MSGSHSEEERTGRGDEPCRGPIVVRTHDCEDALAKTEIIEANRKEFERRLKENSSLCATESSRFEDALRKNTNS